MGKTRVVRLSGLIALALILAGVGGLALAQDAGQQEQPAGQQEPKAEPQEPQTDEAVRTDFVGEIVVTAQKRTENAQEVPISLTAVSGEDFKAIMAGGPDVRFLSARVPSLILESSFGRAFPRFYIRGLGNTDFDLNASQPVSMIVDEVVLENPVVKGMPLFDIDRVEVLRGPQGSLFGRNTPAGVVKFETKKPKQDFQSDWRVSYGTFDTVDISGGVGGALTDTLSARFSGLYQSRSDWVDNLHTGEEDALGGHETMAYRLQFLWEPTEKFNGLLNVHGWEIDGTARIFRANIFKHGTNDLVDDFEQDEVYHDGLNKQEISSMGAVLRLEYDFGGATLTSVTGYESIDDMYSRGDIDGGYGAPWAPPSGPGFILFASESADGIPSLDQVTQELRIASNGGGPFNWLAGVFYFNEEMTADTFSYDSLSPGHPQDGYAFQSQDAESYALFTSVDYLFGEKWLVKAGLRYTQDEKDFAAERPDPTFANVPTVAPITANTDDDFINWDLSATYRANPNLNVYGRVATGSRAPSIQGRILFCADQAGGTDPATTCVTVADTEEITSAEIGVKSILADQKLKLNLAAYVFEVDGQQVTAVGGAYNTSTLLNVDKTEGYGFEADIEYVASANMWTTFGMSYNPTKIKDKNLTVTPCAGGCTVLDPAGPNGTVYVDGNRLPHAPEWIFNQIINFQMDPVTKGFFGSLDWTYHSEKNFFLYESEEFRGDALEIGLRLGYGFAGGKYEVALFGRNITDEVNVEGGIDFNNLTGMTNEPRTVGLEFIARL